MAYAGLSGGFGTLTVGQIWNAAFNHVGAITDKAWFYGNSHTGYRHGNAVSYAMSAGAVSLQLDAIMDGAKDSGDAVDKLEFGMTVDLGDIGKVGLAYTDEKDYTTKVTMYESVSTSTTTISGEIQNTLTGMIMNTVTGEIRNSVTIGEINSQLQGEVNTAITGIELMGGLTAQVALTGWMDPTGMPMMVPQGDCTEYIAGERQEPEITTQANCVNDEETDTVAVWAVDTNLSQVAVPNSDLTIADDSPTAVAINISGVDNISEVTSIRHLDEDGNVLRRVTMWTHGSGDSDQNPDTTAHMECLAADPDNSLICTQVVQYLDADGMNVGRAGVDMSTGTIDLGSGTLDVTGGDLVITNADGDVSTIHEALSVHTTITGTMVDSDISGVGVDSDISGVGVDSDITGLGATTTTTTTTKVAADPGTKMNKGNRKTHVAAEFNLGAVTGHLGYSQIQANGSDAKTKVTHYGVTGGLGDSGMSFLIQARSVDGADGSDSSPWLLALTKGLGGGATVMVEHGNDDDGKSGRTQFGLKVDF